MTNSSKKNKKINTIKAICLVVCAILFFAFVCNLILIVKSIANKDKVPSIFDTSPIYIITGSMDPTIKKGDLAFVKKIKPEKVKEEDIIAFFDPESKEQAVIAHRVKEIFVDDDGSISYLTKGDANDSYDNILISSDRLVGKYTFKLRAMGYVAMFLQSTPGLVLSILIPIFILIACETIRIIQIREEKAEKIGENSENNTKNDKKAIDFYVYLQIMRKK